jgi:hypothetical protein
VRVVGIGEATAFEDPVPLRTRADRVLGAAIRCDVIYETIVDELEARQGMVGDRRLLDELATNIFPDQDYG